jgi:ABC-type nitrate/sulfonate/bicarbonate transport system substrate-binding protein
MTATRRKMLTGIPGLLLLSGCGRKRTEARQIRVVISPRVTLAAFYLAYEKGLFRDEGLDIQIEERKTQVDILPPIAAGQADVAMTGFSAGLCNAISRGARIRIVAARDALIPGCADQSALYYRRSRYPRGLEDARVWKDSRIALQGETPILEFYLDQLLAAKGITRTSVEIVRLTVEEAVAAASTGHLDMFFGSGRPEYLKGGLPKDVARSDIVVSLLGEFQYTYILFGGKLLDGDPELGTVFLRAYLRGVRRFVAGETPKFLDELAGRMHLNPELVKGECRTNLSTTGEIRMGDLSRWLTWAAGKSQIPSDFAVDRLADLRFQRAAAQTL